MFLLVGGCDSFIKVTFCGAAVDACCTCRGQRGIRVQEELADELAVARAEAQRWASVWTSV